MSSSSIPSTATVVDFICLFTHDLKRKQKRWQDGVLKYHTFNKRVMVYDDRSHFIGDAHWQGGGDLEPGDEFELDRGSAIVQVSDCTGKREQDLTELLDKRAKEVEKRRSNAGTRTPGSTAATTHTPRNDQNTPHFQLRHRPLNDLVGGATRIGRAAISPHSPYQVRKMVESPAQQQNSPSEDARPSKRRRRDDSPPSKMGHARALFGTTLTLTPFSSSVSIARSQALPVKTTVKPKDTSTSLRTDLLDLPKRTVTNIEHPCSPDPEDSEICAPHQTAPRRVFTQRASLRELLAGNEQNWNEEHPQPSETMPKNRPHIPEKARPFSPHNQDNVVSLLTQTEQSGRLDNAVQNLPRFASTRQDFGVDKPSKPLHPASVNKDTGISGRNRKQSAETDDAFLSWLAQGESALSGHQTPASPTNSRPPRIKKSRSDKGTTYHKTLEEVSHKVVQNPIQINEDEQSHPSKATQARRRNATLKSLGKNQATALKTHGTKRPLSPDRELPAQTGAGEPPPAKELRTELRIRSRQRRGLLMVAQNKQGDRAGPLGRSSPTLSGTGSDAHTAAHPAIPTIPLPEEFEMAHDDAKDTNLPAPPVKRKDSVVLEHPSSIQEPCNKSANNFGSAAVEKTSDEESSEDPKPLQGLADETSQIEDQASDSIVSEKDRVSVTPRRTNPSRRTREKTAQVVLSDNEEEIAAHNSPSGAGDSDSQDENSSTDTEATRERRPTTRPKAKAETSSGPRITKMSRKSVKSKEIIGFAIPDGDFPRTDFGIGGCGQPKVVANEIMNITTENASHGSYLPLKLPGNAPIAAHQQELARESSRDDQSQRKPLQETQHQGEQPHIEQTPPQPQTKQPPRISNPATRGKKAARKQDAAGLPPQILVQLEPSASSHIASGNSLQKPNLVSDTARSELPGFCKPNGGAWSRHAEDLLGMTRPSKATSRQ
ncbi:hypothetical protein FSPOR_10327 [Fusarium sporotrichioides]|uniref:5'-3' DNA helicase ZGRF1-like N-terminal domain-containing protein n=1 Tax=Fusarium sporotrichioides TaxID=5514 RepID=A0A395RLL3_FUSSP|nr:hypothetical protein FSPOR_10327 [Fusarium sporotrichioides]